MISARTKLRISSLVLLLFATTMLAQEGRRKGTIESMLTSGGYSYFRIMEADSAYWIAVSEMTAEEGDELEFDGQMWMVDFFSKTLQMTFPKVLFAGNVKVVTSGTPAYSPEELAQRLNETEFISIANLKKASKTLAGKDVAVKAEVTKVLPKIMGKTWVHLKDGDGEESTLVVTTQAQNIPLGSHVTILGKVSVDKDFGMGYFYACMIEDAAVIF